MKTPICCSIAALAITALAQAQNLSSQPYAAPQTIVAQSAASVPTTSSLEFYNPDGAGKVCEYLRVFRVPRPYSNSDVTVPSGYTVCVPSWKTQVRSAVDTRSVPVIREIGK